MALCDFCGKPRTLYSHADCTPQGEAARETAEDDSAEDIRYLHGE